MFTDRAADIVKVTKLTAVLFLQPHPQAIIIKNIPITGNNQIKLALPITIGNAIIIPDQAFLEFVKNPAKPIEIKKLIATPSKILVV